MIYFDLTKLIVMISNRDGEVLFKIYPSKTSFKVIYFTTDRVLKIHFRSYKDAETFIDRNTNGRNII